MKRESSVAVLIVSMILLPRNIGLAYNAKIKKHATLQGEVCHESGISALFIICQGTL